MRRQPLVLSDVGRCVIPSSKARHHAQSQESQSRDTATSDPSTTVAATPGGLFDAGEISEARPVSPRALSPSATVLATSGALLRRRSEITGRVAHEAVEVLLIQLGSNAKRWPCDTSEQDR